MVSTQIFNVHQDTQGNCRFDLGLDLLSCFFPAVGKVEGGVGGSFSIPPPLPCRWGLGGGGQGRAKTLPELLSSWLAARALASEHCKLPSSIIGWCCGLHKFGHCFRLLSPLTLVEAPLLLGVPCHSLLRPRNPTFLSSFLG